MTERSSTWAPQFVTRKLDLLMPDGLWYRSSEKFPDNEHLLEPLFADNGTFIACNGSTDILGPKPTLIRASLVQAIRWVEGA